MEPGLRSNSIPRVSIRLLQEVHAPFPVRLGTGVQVTPIAADGLIVIAQSDGGVALLSEHTGERVGSFSISPRRRSNQELFLSQVETGYLHSI
jgi:hypothetical protein